MLTCISRDNTQNYSSGLTTLALRSLENSSRLLFIALIATSLSAQVKTNVQRPRILGISHVAIFVSDIGKARSFYKGVLGFDEPFSLRHPDGTEWMTSIKVNDQQYLELVAEDSRKAGHLSHFALYTNNVALMRDYLASRHVEVLKEVHKGQAGDRFLTVKDPDGHLIEIVEYQPDSLTARANGNFMPATRISNHITHVG